MEKVRKIIFLLFFLLTIVTFPKGVLASSIECENRFATLVNPVRGRNHWGDSSVAPLINQYFLLKSRDLPATWLLTFDAFTDQEVIDSVKAFDPKHEVGVFLEVSSGLARKSRIIFREDQPWKDPGVVFLSGYARSERRKIIDSVFSEFKNTFGNYPKSVGAWWIDSYSEGYMRQKYGITTVLLVSDQLVTDNYGVWGAWWGMPYYPSEKNILTPIRPGDKQGVVVIQWAQRDPERAYGEGYQFSNYSLQANDYTSFGLKTDYFKNIVGRYLDCSNKVGQITVGLETGMEASGFSGEYKNQIDYLASIDNLKFETMSTFAEKLKEIYPDAISGFTVTGENSKWELTTEYRRNDFLSDYIKYDSNLVFSDYFVSDKSSLLKRYLPISVPDGKHLSGNLAIPALIMFSFLIFRSFGIKKILLVIGGVILTFGSLLRSGNYYGWVVNYGPDTGNLYFWQFTVIFTTLTFYYFVFRKNWLKNYIYIYPLSFFIDKAILNIKYTFIEGVHYLGYLADPLTLIGLKFNGVGIGFFNNDMPFFVARSLIGIDYEVYFGNSLVYFVISPLVHIFVTVLTSLTLFRLKGKTRILFISLLGIVTCLWILELFKLDPLSVSKIM